MQGGLDRRLDPAVVADLGAGAQREPGLVRRGVAGCKRRNTAQAVRPEV